MRTKAERRVRHTSDLRRVRRKNDSKLTTRTASRESVVQDKGAVYKKINLENQEFYIKLSTTKEE
mgnify:CR=1 FL=1|tara:strand:+ start:1165 stop:1359 length:195 start_codon:yes stop_codon:yes gene_type:complete